MTRGGAGGGALEDGERENIFLIIEKYSKAHSYRNI